MLRVAYLCLGLLFTGLGIVGAFLPVLPTTPLLLVALWAFAKSSRRLETWLLEHPRFGPGLVAWRAHRVIPLPVKLTAWGTMVASLTIMAITTRSWFVVGTSGSLMAIGAIYIATRPSSIAQE